MHNSFIFQQYVCYTTLLNMFRAARCSSSGGPILSPRPVVSSPSVNSRTVRRLRADWMHNFFILQQYVCYTTILNMFRAARCSSTGGPIVSPQPLVSSPSVSSRTVCRWLADRCPPAYCTAHVVY